MATPMIEQFPKGKLNKCWHYIELCKFVHPELTETIDRLRDTLIRYTLVKPWPLPENAEPETFRVRFFAKEHEDFYYYLGFGQGIRASLQSDLPQEDKFDLEKAITENCLGRAVKPSDGKEK